MSSVLKNKHYQLVDGALGLSVSVDNTPLSNTANFGNAIGRECFFKQLRHEKHRAQRSGSALSLLLLSQIKTNGEKSAVSINGLLKIVRSKMRETDMVGYFDQHTLGLLLPYTDNIGAKNLSQKIMGSFSCPKLSVIIATYPDDIFDSLANESSLSSDALGLMLENSIQNSQIKLSIKRGFDLIGAVMALLILSPIMLITAVMVKLSSPGPIIFKQIRVGHKGVPFTFYKFRSMRTGASDQIHREFVTKLINGDHSAINNGDKENPLYKIKFDPRVTRIGRFIRKTSIDELPQLFNVLKGDMTLVGPRPPLPYETEKYQAWQLRRILDMKPGITGLWQVEGRGRTEFNDAVRLDIQYTKKWSLLLDIIISCKTIKEVLNCRGAV